MTRTLPVCTTAALLLATTVVGHAETPSRSTSPDIEFDAAAVAAVVDEFVPPAMQEADIPGAAVAVVHAGRIIYLSGFGWADVEARIAVDPERTVFRLGSLSKPVTATAVLSVLGDVSFDLDQDVVPLLDDLAFRPDRSGPITLRQLLTHMAGFNENLFGQHAANAADWLPLDVYLRRHLTPRFAPPGVAIAYTDFHTSLAGLAAARLTGRPFEQLVEERVFGPLGMERSSFRQVGLPAVIEAGLARAYGRADGQLTPYRRDYIHTTPAAGLQGTASDMARYLIALLDDGRLDGRGGVALDAAAWRLQKTVHHRHDARLDGKALGLTEVRHGGRTLLYKNGQASGFHARLLLAPAERLALFSVHNRSILDPMGSFNAASRFHQELGWALFDAVLPEIERPPLGKSKPAAGTAARLPAYEGVYRTTVTSRHTLEKVISMMSDLEVERLQNDRLRIGGGTYLETEPGLMQYEGARFYIRFAEPDSSGRAPYLFVGAGAYERIPWYESSTSTTRFGIVFGSLFLLTLAVFGWRSWRLRAARAPEAAAGRRVVRLGLAVAGSYLLYLVAFGLILVTTDIQYLFHGWPTTLKIALVLPLLGLLATAGLGLALAMPSARREAGRLTSLLAGLLVAGSAGFLWWLHLWNMLGWRL